MSGLEKSLFNLKFTAKQLSRQAAKAGKDEVTEKNKLKKVHPSPPPFPSSIFQLHPSPPPHSTPDADPQPLQAIQQNHPDIAKIYAQNAIRKQNEKLNLLRLGSRIDAVASRVQTAVTMRAVTGSMAGVVRGMDTAMKAMDLEKVRTPLPLRFSDFRHLFLSGHISTEVDDARSSSLAR